MQYKNKRRDPQKEKDDLLIPTLKGMVSAMGGMSKMQYKNKRRDPQKEKDDLLIAKTKVDTERMVREQMASEKLRLQSKLATEKAAKEEKEKELALMKEEMERYKELANTSNADKTALEEAAIK